LRQQDSHLQTADLGLEYWDAEKMQSEWGQTGYDEQNQKLRYAVAATYGEVLTYQGNLIDALYHSVSIGQTVSAQELYGKDVPYLTSVESSYDVESKDYMQMFVYRYEDVMQCVQKWNTKEMETQDSDAVQTTENVQGNDAVQTTETAQASDTAQATTETTQESALYGLTQDNFTTECAVADKTDSGYVKQVKVGTMTVTGNEFQEAFALPSLCFYMEEQDGALRIVCLGKGHGMGLSQYGANAMAKNGDSYKDILEHYYKGVELTNITQ
jgi:stage II sporulation protein D